MILRLLFNRRGDHHCHRRDHHRRGRRHHRRDRRHRRRGDHRRHHQNEGLGNLLCLVGLSNL